MTFVVETLVIAPAVVWYLSQKSSRVLRDEGKIPHPLLHPQDTMPPKPPEDRGVRLLSLGELLSAPRLRFSISYSLMSASRWGWCTWAVLSCDVKRLYEQSGCGTALRLL
jgi:hypothetical protein